MVAAAGGGVYEALSGWGVGGLWVVRGVELGTGVGGGLRLIGFCGLARGACLLVMDALLEHVSGTSGLLLYDADCLIMVMAY